MESLQVRLRTKSAVCYNNGILTGIVRDVKYQYKAYKVVTNEKGKQGLQESELVDNILAIKDEYPYFKLSDYKEKVYSAPYKLEKVKVKE